MKFSMDFWNDDHYKNFEMIANHFKDKSPNILEIGTFEGRTSFWLLDNIPNSKVTVIDPDVGPKFGDNFNVWSQENDIERFKWKMDYSYPSLLEEFVYGRKYDLIYVDGDHNASGLLEDAIMSWKILKNNGILLFDDYMMEIRDPWFYICHKEFQTYKKYGLTFHHPKEAIDVFLSIYKGQYQLYIDNYQVGVIKLCELERKNLNHGDSSQRAIYENNERTSR